MVKSNPIDLLKKEVPSNVIEIAEKLNEIMEILSFTIDEISKKIVTAMNNRDFETLEEYNNLAKELKKYEDLVTNYITYLDVSNDVLLITKNPLANSEQFEPNDKADNTQIHTLFDDWTYRKPYGFSFINKRVNKANSWKDVFIKTCKILYKMDEEKFIGFESIDKMNGKKKKNFSKSPDVLRKPKSITKRIFVETNHSANTFRRIIIRMLKQYKLDLKDYCVYYSVD